MIYIDENLCTGCGLCLDACKQGALSLQGNVVVVDAEVCTSCNRCAAVCMTGAIRPAEIVSLGASSTAPVQPAPAPAILWAAPSPYPTPPAALQRTEAFPIATKPVPSKLMAAGKFLSALAGLVVFAIERKDSTGEQTCGPLSRATDLQPRGAGRGRRDGSGRGRKSRQRDNRCRAAGRGLGT